MNKKLVRKEVVEPFLIKEFSNLHLLSFHTNQNPILYALLYSLYSSALSSFLDDLETFNFVEYLFARVILMDFSLSCSVSNMMYLQ